MNLQFDFTYRKFNEILESLNINGYSFQTLEDYVKNPLEKAVILRHDVDRSPLHSLHTAQIENSRGIRGTYYFRIVKQSNQPQVIREIADLGHEIGYHYEDLSLSHGISENAINSFESNLSYFRTFYPVKTICMHGSPTSKWDNRDLWKKYSYKDYGIIAEPYFDLDYNNILYLTDTGRKWNGEKSSVRDKVFQGKFLSVKEKMRISDDIMKAVSSNKMARLLMITIHPQRWSDNMFIWMWEYSTQAMKNIIKQMIFVR